MTQPDRITLVLRACEAAPLSQMLPFINVGDLVSAGRGLAVIDSATEVDLKAELDMREAQLHEADALLRESIAYINDDQDNVEFRDMLIARIDQLLDRDREPQAGWQP